MKYRLVCFRTGTSLQRPLLFKRTNGLLLANGSRGLYASWTMHAHCNTATVTVQTSTRIGCNCATTFTQKQKIHPDPVHLYTFTSSFITNFCLRLCCAGPVVWRMHSREVIALYYARCLAKHNNKRTREYSYPFNRLSSVRCEKRTSFSWYIAALVVVCVCVCVM